MTARVGYVLGALILGIGALVGVQFSSATFTDDSNLPAQVTAARDWTPPTISVDDPGFVITGIVSITATAADEDTSVQTVEIQYSQGDDEWTSLCTDSSSPWDCTWDTETVTDGTYDLRAIATDVDGNVETSEQVSTEVRNTRGVVIDPVPNPVGGTVALTAHFVNAGSASTTITFQGTASGTSNWFNLPGCTNLSGPEASCSFDTTMGGTGSYDLRVVATRFGSTYYDTQTDIFVDNTVPTVALTVPSGALGGSVTLTATAADTHTSVAGVVFETRRQLAGSPWVSCGTDAETPYACILDTSTLSDGTHEFRATATDAAGNKATTAVQTRVVDNTAPSLSFTSPSGTISGTVNLTATASDSGSGMASVAFQYQLQGSGTWITCGGTPDTTSPYACSLNTTTLTNGTYQFRAVATDNAGRTTTSSTGTATVMNVSVDLATPPAAVGAAGTQLSATWYGPGTPSIIFERAPVGSSTYTLICTVTATPSATCNWNTATINQANYNVRARVVVSGTTYTDLHTMYVDRTAPSAAAVSVPAQPLNGTIQLTGTASDALSGVGSMLFEYKLSTASTWTTCGTDNSSPYSCPVDTTTLTDASYNFRATAYDLAGNLRVSATETRTVNTAVSSVSVTSPTAGSTVQGTTTVTANATSTKPITSVTLQYLPSGGSWTTICPPVTSAPYSCSWNTSGLARGTYQLRAVLTQANTYTVTSAAVSVTVERFRGLDVQATSGSNQGQPGINDTMSFTYSGLVDLDTLKSGWNGSSTPTPIVINASNVGGGPGLGGDWMNVPSVPALGTVTFGQNYVDDDRSITFGGSSSTMTASTVTVDGVQVTRIVLAFSARTSGGSGNWLNDTGSTTGAMRWVPSTAAKDTNGNAVDPTLVTESGAVDADL